MRKVGKLTVVETHVEKTLVIKATANFTQNVKLHTALNAIIKPCLLHCYWPLIGN